MPGCGKRIWKKLFGSKERRVLLLGLDAAGKTTILYYLQGKAAQTVPTIGFNVERVNFPPLELLIWDLSGQDKTRNFWRHYYHGTTGIVFVIDTNDVERLALAKKELDSILHEEELENAALLLMANKTDLPRAVSNEELERILGLSSISDRPVHIQRCVASKGDGVKEGLLWLAKNMPAVGEKAQEKKEDKNNKNTKAKGNDTEKKQPEQPQQREQNHATPTDVTKPSAQDQTNNSLSSSSSDSTPAENNAVALSSSSSS